MRGVAPGSGSGAAGSGLACCTVGGTATPAAEDRAAGALDLAAQRDGNRDAASTSALG